MKRDRSFTVRVYTESLTGLQGGFPESPTTALGERRGQAHIGSRTIHPREIDMKALLVATILALGLSVAHAGLHELEPRPPEKQHAAPDLELIKGRIDHGHSGYTSQSFTLKNNTDRHFEVVYGKCGMFDRDELVDTGTLAFRNIPAHSEAYDDTGSDVPGITRIECRIEQAK